ncbi:MAG: hypothetical protein IT285_00625 [Bdellovibrionales bacterium]|nr:hypothetical protein [Bdellovibrionales bacterium]
MSGWIPLVDYAVKNGVSLSTLRRHIKADKIRYQRVGGKYLIWDDGPRAAVVLDPPKTAQAPQNDMVSLQRRMDRMERQLKNAQEEIAELKMLVALYEDRMPEKLEN